jgi:hypothetical protein
MSIMPDRGRAGEGEQRSGGNSARRETGIRAECGRKRPRSDGGVGIRGQRI